MSTILTDDELPPMPDGTHPQSMLGQMLRKYADAREAAVLAKLAQQEPVAWQSWSDKNGYGYWDSKQEADQRSALDFEPVALYTHPAPQQADRQRVPDGWVNAVQKIADENEVEPSFVTMVFDDLLPAFLADKDAAGYVTLPRDSLIENDSYGVYGSDFYRCKVCGAESGAGVLNKGIQHNHNCPLAAAPEAPAQASAVDERQPLTDEQIVNMANPTQHLPDAPEGWVRFGFSRRHLVGFARSIERAHGIGGEGKR